MSAVLDYVKVPVTIQYYVKSQSYAKTTWTPYYPRDTIRAHCSSAAAATSSTLEEVFGLKTNDDGTFTLDGKFYPLKAFLPEEIYLRKISRVFWDAHREKNIGLSLNPDEKDRIWMEEKNYNRTLKYAVTKADTNSEEADDSNKVSSDITFKVAAAPAHVQSNSASAALTTPEYPTVKGIFSASGDQMQVSTNTATGKTDTVTLIIHKSQASMLTKNGATLIDQGGNS